MDKRDKVLGKWSPNWERPFKVIQVFSNGAYKIEELAFDERTIRINGKCFKKCRPVLQEVKIVRE